MLYQMYRSLLEGSLLIILTLLVLRAFHILLILVLMLSFIFLHFILFDLVISLKFLWLASNTMPYAYAIICISRS